MPHYSSKEWIPVCILGLFTLIINGFILMKEIQKRKAGNATFSSKFLSLWSFLCILFGVLQGLEIFTFYFDGFCYFMWYLHYVFAMNQPVMMGFYQLSRLSYCFSKKEMYSNTMFIAMYAIGAVLILDGIVFCLFEGKIPTHCGIDQTYSHYVEYLDFESKTMYLFLLYLFSLIYLFWDITTLLLYIFGIRSFKKMNINSKNIDIYKRILSTLHKILIITLFYEIMVFIIGNMSYLIKFNNIVTDGSIWAFTPASLSSILYSYSAFIMLEHNNSQYIKFLKIISFFKLDYLCCCYKYVVSEQLNVSETAKVELQSVFKHKTNVVTMDNKNNCKICNINLQTSHRTLASESNKTKQILKSGDKYNDIIITNTDNKLPLKFKSKSNISSSTITNSNTINTTTSEKINVSITSTNVTAKINKTDFPPFTLNEKYIEEAEIIYVMLLKLKLIISMDCIIKIISQYAATMYKSCVDCGDRYGFIECSDDYCVKNGALANCNPLCNDEIRYFLNCNSSNMQDNIVYYDGFKHVLCVKCSEKWKCTICNTQFVSESLENIIVDGCDKCGCVICEECGWWFKTTVLCHNCAPQSEKDKTISYKSIKSTKSKSSNNLSNWGNFEFSF